jgi:hypothetical protein
MNPKPGWIFALLPVLTKPPGGADGGRNPGTPNGAEGADLDHFCWHLDALLPSVALTAGVVEPKYPMVGSLPACCARAASGQATAVPPRSVMNWRRFMGSPFRPRTTP